MSCKDVCIDSGWDLDMPSFSNNVIRRAAKPHVCEECGDAILKGDRYEYASGMWDGEFMAFKTCLVCVEVRTAFTCGGYAITQLWENMRDEMFPHWNELVAIDCLAKLKTDAAIGKVRTHYSKYCESTDGEHSKP